MNTVMVVIRYLPRMWKAVYAGATAASFSYGALRVDGMTLPEWGYLIGAIIVAVGGTWKITNAPAG